VESAAKALEGAGAVVDEVSLTHVAHVATASAVIVASEALAYHAPWMRARAHAYQPDARERLRLGALVTRAHCVRGQQIGALLTRGVDDAPARRDVLPAPATPIAAPVLGERETTLGDGPSDVRAALLRCTRPFNFSGPPACAAPCGFTAGGLPI